MQVWDRLKTAFDTGGKPKLPPNLDASSEDALSRSIRILPGGNRGWITIRETRVLFTPLRDEYALGDFDEEGKGKIARFAAQKGHHSDFYFMPAEDRVYFIRSAGG